MGCNVKAGVGNYYHRLYTQGKFNGDEVDEKGTRDVATEYLNYLLNFSTVKAGLNFLQAGKFSTGVIIVFRYCSHATVPRGVLA